jgi:hypothetical protein
MRALPWIVALAGALLAWLLAGTGFVNYDTAYTLVWGGDVAHGRAPDFGVPVAPTPHPLATALAVALQPLGDAAADAWVVLAFVALGALAGLTYVLGARWFGSAAGLLAAAIVVTREPVLSFGARAYVDLPYVVFVLAAVAAEARRPRAGLPVLLALAAAGLLRPEAWLFSALYLAYLWRHGSRDWRLVVLAASAPALWMAADWLLAGDPLHSLTGTRENAEALQRRTGLDDVPVTVPRRLGEILREPVLLGAALGGTLSLAFLRERARLGAVVGFTSIGAFCVLAAAGLPILGRYLLLPATMLAIFCGAGCFGWRLLDAGHPWRRRWQAGAMVVALAFLAFLPAHVDRLQRLRAALGAQAAIQDDLHALAPVLRRGCAPVGVPNHRLVPLLALWLDRPPADIVSAQLRRLESGQFVDPASERVERQFTLDRNDPRRLTAEVPPGFAPVARNASWVIYARC